MHFEDDHGSGHALKARTDLAVETPIYRVFLQGAVVLNASIP